MSVGIIMDFAAGESDQYDRVIEQMELDGKVAPGAHAHVAGPGPDGGWRVVDVWESPEQFEAFANEKIAPLTQAEGLPEPALTFFEINETRDTDRPRETITFFQVVSFPAMDAESFKAMDDEII